MIQEILDKTVKQLYLAGKMFKYNLKIIFANKFIFFLLGAVVFYLIITIIDLLDPESYFNEGNVYSLLLFPGLLIIFYPSTFGIQNDVDSRTIEVLFGIPDYRYKIWLSRLLIIFIVLEAKEIKTAFRLLFIFITLSLFFSIPYYLRNYLDTGNPVYPFFYDIFDGKYLNLEKSNLLFDLGSVTRRLTRSDKFRA